MTNFDISHYIQCQPPPQAPQPPSPFHELPPPQIQLPKNLDPDDHPAIAEHPPEQPSNLWMDPTYDLVPVSDIALEIPEELLDMFNGAGFEENIELLFEGSAASCTAASTGSHEASESSEMKFDGIFDDLGIFEGDFLSGFDQSDQCGWLEETLTACIDSISYPFPLSICS